jgi:hypothetical protein
VQQCHRLTDVINKAMEHQQYCTAALSDLSQAFDKEWQHGLLFKSKELYPQNISTC